MAMGILARYFPSSSKGSKQKTSFLFFSLSPVLFQDFLYKFPLGVQNIKFIFFKIAQDNIIAGENIKIKCRPEDVIFCSGSQIWGLFSP